MNTLYLHKIKKTIRKVQKDLVAQRFETTFPFECFFLNLGCDAFVFKSLEPLVDPHPLPLSPSYSLYSVVALKAQHNIVIIINDPATIFQYLL